MKKINIDTRKSKIRVKIFSESVYEPRFEITVIAPDAKTVIEKYTGDTKINNPYIKTLEIKPVDCKGYFINGIFKLNSPDGSDFPFSTVFSVLEDDDIVEPFYTLSGTTINGVYIGVAGYIMNFDSF